MMIYTLLAFTAEDGGVLGMLFMARVVPTELKFLMNVIEEQLNVRIQILQDLDKAQKLQKSFS